MLSQSISVLTCVLLLLTLCPDVLSRRGGFGGGRWGGIGRTGGGGWGGAGAHRGAGVGGGHHYKAPHVQSGSSSSGSNAGKIAGAAAAGALGGMVIGHGLSSMSRPGYGRTWHGGYDGYGPGYGGGYGYPRYSGGHGNGHVGHEDGFRNETDMEYYVGAASRGHTYSCVLLFGTTVSFLIGYWIS
ncbi:prion protein a [Pangasianodon hypophthalmus]|uniref:prion protein a n=1 Tax=Pangasianodon hypophthalmus TaxID=310915 RepID=UPI0023074830|nr:prion protein a [Pangasianodon hypophthalmus]